MEKTINNLKIGTELYKKEINRYTNYIEYGIYTVIGETKKYWRVQLKGSSHIVLCSKDDLGIRGEYNTRLKVLTSIVKPVIFSGSIPFTTPTLSSGCTLRSNTKQNRQARCRHYAKHLPMPR